MYSQFVGRVLNLLRTTRYLQHVGGNPPAHGAPMHIPSHVGNRVPKFFSTSRHIYACVRPVRPRFHVQDRENDHQYPTGLPFHVDTANILQRTLLKELDVGQASTLPMECLRLLIPQASVIQRSSTSPVPLVRSPHLALVIRAWKMCTLSTCHG